MDGGIIEYGAFLSHSGIILPWKINCDAFTGDDWAALAHIVRHKFPFSDVVGVPRGGLRFAEALKPYCVEGYPTLIVDDVLTTGKLMEKWRRNIGGSVIGVVVFARQYQEKGGCPNWIWPIFVVQEWAQARGTGVG